MISSYSGQIDESSHVPRKHLPFKTKENETNSESSTAHNKGEPHENSALLFTDVQKFQEHPGRLGTRKKDIFTF